MAEDKIRGLSYLTEFQEERIKEVCDLIRINGDFNDLTSLDDYFYMVKRLYHKNYYHKDITPELIIGAVGVRLGELLRQHLGSIWISRELEEGSEIVLYDIKGDVVYSPIGAAAAFWADSEAADVKQYFYFVVRNMYAFREDVKERNRKKKTTDPEKPQWWESIIQSFKPEKEED